VQFLAAPARELRVFGVHFERASVIVGRNTTRGDRIVTLAQDDEGHIMASLMHVSLAACVHTARARHAR
jgi:hypothetical protein